MKKVLSGTVWGKKNCDHMKVVFITPAPPGISPGQRFRFEHYLELLKEKNIDFVLKPYISIPGWKILYNKGNTLKKSFILIKGIFKRIVLLFQLPKFDFVYLYRESAPFGPPVFEWFIAKILRKKIIYDFDDSIWINMSSSSNPKAAYIKCTWKVKYICKWSYITTVGNDYLATYARKYCSRVIVIPTVVDTEKVHNRVKDQLEEPLTIGWTGTFTNFYNLNLITEPVKMLQKKYRFSLLMIADKDPMLTGLTYEFIKWNKTTEISDLLKANIGLMPLYNTEVELGKCAFKAIQYMALGIPSVVSPVGANCKVVDNGINGYWADSDTEWYNSLEKLIASYELRNKMGIEAKEKILNQYSVNATAYMFINLFK